MGPKLSRDTNLTENTQNINLCNLLMLQFY